MRLAKAVLLCFLLSISFLMAGCVQQAPQAYFRDRSGMYFEFPYGWSRLSKEEWRERNMGEDRTLVTIMDSERRAGFSVIPINLSKDAQTAFEVMADTTEDRLSMYIDSLYAAGPSRYQNYIFFNKGTTKFAGLPVGEITFQGRNPGKELKWYRVLVFALPRRQAAVIMFVFTAPMGKHYSFKKDFEFIEDTWKWHD